MINQKILADVEAIRAAPLPPERIVSLTSIASELIYIFGCIDRIVGRDDHSTFPPALGEKPAVGSSIYKTISAERVLALDPDVVVTGRRIPQAEFEKIESADIPVLVIGTSCELEALLGNIQTLGKLLASEKKAGELVEFVERYADLIKERTRDLDIEDKPRVYNECAFGKYAPKACAAADEGITLAGGVNIIVRDEASDRSVVGGEWLARSNPDIIISQISTMSSATEKMLNEKRDEILARQELTNTNAVRDGKVYISHLSLRRGPRMVGYLLYLARWFHPELFEDIDPDAVEREMLRKFYGLDLEGTWAYPEI